jgi:hypothetical protein
VNGSATPDIDRNEAIALLGRYESDLVTASRLSHRRTHGERITPMPVRRRILLRQRESTGAGTDQLHEARLDVMLLAPSRIDYGRHRFRELGHSHRLAAVASMPTIEEIHHLAAGGVNPP